jgi:membrane-associated protease RseP (regulator of RpoE activity)
LQLPRGAQLLAVDGEAVSNWQDVVDKLLAAAGREIEVRYRSGADEATGRMRVPSSFVNELNLPPTVWVTSINDEKEVPLPGANGKDTIAKLGANPRAIEALLKRFIGQTVTIRYGLSSTDAPREARFTVREDNVQPWQMSIVYDLPSVSFESRKTLLSAGLNPIAAIGMAVGEVRSMLSDTYLFLRLLFVKSNASVQQVSGPVGIFGAAIERAKVGYVELLYFLAMLSVNLAVVNFLPLPVMDGGLMVFLLIEKIKGKPLSIKTQVVSTLVGLAAIVLIGLFVTIQDISRLFDFQP